MWIVKRTELGEQFLSTWWHINNSERNLRWPAHEQDTLSSLMFNKHRGLAANHVRVSPVSVVVGGYPLNELVGAIDEPTMVDVTQSRLQFVRHKYNEQALDRVPFFERRIRFIQSDSLHFKQRGTETNFIAVVKQIAHHHTLLLAMDTDRVPLPPSFSDSPSPM